MAFDLDELTDHDASEDCPICRAQQVVAGALVPAAASWELHHELPRFSLALHGAAIRLVFAIWANTFARPRAHETLPALQAKTGLGFVTAFRLWL